MDKTIIHEKTISKGDVYRKYIFDELSKKIKDSKKLEDLEHYVDSLSDHKAKKLCCKLSHSRKNPVYSFISRGPDQWLIENVKVSKIYMIGINHRVNQYLRENGMSLRKNSKDERIRKNKEFKKKGDIHPRCMTLIGQKMDGYRYRLIDGNHRAIKLACSGEKKIKLICY